MGTDTSTKMKGKDNMNTKAFDRGLKDGAIAADERSATAEQVEAWFAAGQLEPDEGLINACTTNELANYLGFDAGDEDARSLALEAYNQGYRTGARQAVAE